jgi:uncharacterized protein (TIRG00374 family)
MGVSLYLVAPSVIDVFGSWDELGEVTPWWLAGMVVLQAGVLACLVALQSETLRTKLWHPVATAQLSSNALAKIAPGGGAVGAALQYRLLVQAGFPGPTVASGLTAANLLTLALVLAMPVMAIPSIIRGLVPGGLVNITLTGVGVFVLLALVAAACLASDKPLAWIGRTVQRVRNRLRPKAEPLTTLPARLLRERDAILRTLGRRWPRALAATTGRWALDYACLLAALAAIGSHPRASLVLLAFCAAQLLAQIPVTPGGLGFVEAGLTGMLTLAGVGAGNAALATFTYRLVSYWLPLPAGLVAYIMHRRRYGSSPPGTPPPSAEPKRPHPTSTG